MALLCLAGFTKLSLEVLEATFASINQEMLLALHQAYTPAGAFLAASLSWLTEAAVLVTLAVVAAIVVWFKGRRAQALVLGLNALGAGGLTFGLKVWMHQPRPALFQGLIIEDGHGYPSGHALVMLSLFGIVAMLWGDSLPHGRKLLWLLAILGSALVGLARLYLGVHWPTDILGGYLAAIPWVWVCWLCYGPLRRRLGETPRAEPESSQPEVSDLGARSR